jgi:hypothetical protein
MKKIFFACALFSFFGLLAPAYATEDATGEIVNEDTKAFKIGLQATTEI